MLGPVRGFMGQCGVVAFGSLKRLEWRHADVIGFLRVVGPRSTMADIGLERGEEFFRMLDALDRIEARLGLGIVVLG
jgi:hypothetical protein